MPRKKKPFNKKQAHKFQVVHRSLNDPVFHEDNGSRYVLLPVNQRARDAPEAVFDAADVHTLPEGVSYPKRAGADARAGAGAGAGAGVGTGSGAAPRPSAIPGTTRLRNKYDEMDAEGFPLDGYDYQQHLRPIGHGGVFVSASGKTVSSTKLLPKKPLQLPADVLPGEEVSDRMLESIVINPKRLPQDMQQALAGDAEEEFEELTDDFVLLAGAEEDGDGFADEGFDLDAHLAKLMAAAEVEERGEDLWATTDPDDGHDDSDDGAAVAGGAAAERTDAEKPLAPLVELEGHLDVVLAQYGDDRIGELDPEDADVMGAGRMEDWLEAAMAEFLESKKATPVFALASTREATLGTGAACAATSAGAGAAAGGDGAAGGADGAAASGGAADAPVVPFGWGADDFMDGTDADIPLPRPPKRPDFDCDTIISTYTNTENHPTVLDDDDYVPRIRLSAKTGMPILTEDDGGDASDDGDHDGEEGDNDDDAGVGLPATMPEELRRRPKRETAEERRARKAAVKELRRAKREQKKATKDAFKAETKRQVKQRAGGNKQSVFKM